MFNPTIIAALIAQSFVSKISRIAGAITGYAITTGILIWGLSVYGDGSQIAIFTIPLSQQAFIIACLIWYSFDTKEFMTAYSEFSIKNEGSNSPLLQEEPVIQFYQDTLNAWASGTLSQLNKGFENEGKINMDRFIRSYPPYKGSALACYFEQFQPLAGEFMIGLGNLESKNDPGWFVLTNLRLIQRDGKDNKFMEVFLGDVQKYESTGSASFTLTFYMNSGEKITFDEVLMHPTEKFLDYAINQPVVHSVESIQLADAHISVPQVMACS